MLDAGDAWELGVRPLTIFEAADRHGAFHWTERRLYELTGAWAAAAGVPPEARLQLFEASGEHAWHAQLWWDRMPVLAGVDRERLSRPAGPVVGPLLAALGRRPAGGSVEPDTAGRGDGGQDPWPDVDVDLDSVGFLALLCRLVLPRLAASYRRLGERLVAATDGPSARVLGLVLRDEVDEVVRGESLLRTLEGDSALRNANETIVRAYREAVSAVDPGDELLPWSEGHSAWSAGRTESAP